MRIALDTNILVDNQNRSDPRHHSVSAALRRHTDQGAELCLAPQALYEFWVVATRPTQVNGLGLRPEAARREIDLRRLAFTLLPDHEQIVDRWLDLCTTHVVSGRPAHDARIVAWMLGHGIKRLVTLNTADFQRYTEIECITPD